MLMARCSDSQHAPSCQGAARLPGTQESQAPWVPGSLAFPHPGRHTLIAQALRCPGRIKSQDILPEFLVTPFGSPRTVGRKPEMVLEPTDS